MMKFIVIFYVLFTLTFSIPSVFSYNYQKARLHDILRRSLEIETNPLVFGTQNDKIAYNQPFNFDEYENNLHARNIWDSGENEYFQWANQNRRPVEYLTGRKRGIKRMVLSARDRRINGGLWRSGLVG